MLARQSAPLQWRLGHLAASDVALRHQDADGRQRTLLAAALRDALECFLAGLRQRHGERQAIDAVHALTVQRHRIERRWQALACSHASLQMIQPTARSHWPAECRARRRLAQALVAPAYGASFAPGIPLFGTSCTSAELLGFAGEALLRELSVADASRDWLIEQLAAALPGLARSLDASLTVTATGSRELATTVVTGVAPDAGQLAALWLDSHRHSDLDLPLLLRSKLPRLRPVLAELGERDATLWHSPLHPGRRLLRDWLASTLLRQERDARASCALRADRVEADLALLSETLMGLAGAPRQVPQLAGLVLRSRVAQDARLLRQWQARELGGQRSQPLAANGSVHAFSAHPAAAARNGQRGERAPATPAVLAL